MSDRKEECSCACSVRTWVEKMLHDDQVTSAPMAVRVSMRTALKKDKGKAGSAACAGCASCEARARLD